MPAHRAILCDIDDKGLDHSVAHHALRDGTFIAATKSKIDVLKPALVKIQEQQKKVEEVVLSKKEKPAAKSVVVSPVVKEEKSSPVVVEVTKSVGQEAPAVTDDHDVATTG